MNSIKFFIYGMLVVITTFTVHADSVITAKEVAAMRYNIAVKISPDGNKIAYLTKIQARPLVDADSTGWINLNIVDSNGKSRTFIGGKCKVYQPEWTPDGKALTFLAKRGDDQATSLYLIPIDGGEASKIAEHKNGIRSYQWSADGKQIAFLAQEDQNETDTKNQEQGYDQIVYEEQWQSVKVWTVTPQDPQVHWQDRPEIPQAKALDLKGSASSMAWSPDGKFMAITLAPTPAIDDHYMKRKINIVDVQTGKSIKTIETKGKLGKNSWSPDSKNLAIVAAQDINDPNAGRLFVYSLKQDKMTQLLLEFQGDITDIAWQDNNYIMYIADIGVHTTFAKIDKNGNNQKNIVEPGDLWLVRFDLAKGGKNAAFLASSKNHALEIYTMRHGDKAPKRLTDINPWLKDKKLGKQEVITYNAKDGLSIQGILIHPVDEQKGKKYPLVVIVHGGPESHYGHEWLTSYSRPGQILAGKGFAVFYPNYRGSTGRGVKFSKMGQADYAGKEFQDIVDGVDYLIGTGLVDKDKVGVTGGSYGGFATAWCSTYYSERFAAGVMYMGISDQVSKFGTTDIPNEMYLVHARKWPWQDWEFFRQRSPLTYFEKCRTPLLISHGKEDTRVHPSQAMVLYRYLKTYGKVPVRLVFYKGEGHGYRKASSRYDYTLRLVRWMEYYLKQNGKNLPPHQLNY